jgi:hypothetical protein
LADVLGLADVVPLQTQTDAVDKVVTFVPHDNAQRVLDALADAGAGGIGDYSRCAWTVAGVGTFRPEAGAHPTIGSVGQVEEVPETRIEMVLPRARRREVVRALVSAHPYDTPAYDVYELADLPTNRGLGRVGVLPEPLPLREFAQRVAAALPTTAAGVRASGDPARTVRTAAVCGGAGDSLLGVVRAAGVDAYVTADLRHHPASEHDESGGPALIDAGHWATEWPWLARAAADLTETLQARAGVTVEASVSTLVTDPWRLQVTEESTVGS